MITYKVMIYLNHVLEHFRDLCPNTQLFVKIMHLRFSHQVMNNAV